MSDKAKVCPVCGGEPAGIKGEFGHLADAVYRGEVFAMVAVSLSRENGDVIPTVHAFGTERIPGDTAPLMEITHGIGRALQVAFESPAEVQPPAG